MKTLANWGARRWAIAAVAGLAITLALGIPTDVIPNPVFGRPVDVTWWSSPVLFATAILGGLLAATYVDDSGREGGHEGVESDDLDRPGKVGSLGGLVSFFAIGCPTCNKLVVLAVGTTGALDWFAPAQPLFALVSVLLLGWALRTRLRTTERCRIAARGTPTGNMSV